METIYEDSKKEKQTIYKILSNYNHLILIFKIFLSNYRDKIYNLTIRRVLNSI